MLKKKYLKTCFIIPAYNEQNNISKVILALKKIGNVIVVDDCSQDQTGLISKKNEVIVIRHNKNYGYERALYSGFKKAKKLSFEYIITIDADGQHFIKDAKKILVLLHKNYAMVHGKRNQVQRFSEKIFALYTSFLYGIGDPLCGLKGYNLKICENYGLLDKKNGIGTNVLLNLKNNNIKTFEVKVSQKKRRDKTRFGGILRGNLKIFNVLFQLVAKDLFKKITLK